MNIVLTKNIFHFFKEFKLTREKVANLRINKYPSEDDLDYLQVFLASSAWGAVYQERGDGGGSVPGTGKT